MGVRSCGFIKQNHRLNMPNHMLFVDCETVPVKEGDFDRQVLRLGVCCYVRRRKGSYSEKWFVFKSEKEFWLFLNNIHKSRTKLYVFAHNADFDFNVLGFRVVPRELGYEPVAFRWDAGSWFTIFAKYRENSKGKRVIDKKLILLDTMNFFHTSLAELGRHIGVEKLSVNFETASEDELVTYCRRDVEIIKEACLRLISWLEQHDLGSFALTAGGLAFNVYRHKFGATDIYIHSNDEALELERRSYRGGRCEAFIIGRYNGKVYQLDVNSLYPYIMRNMPLPNVLVGIYNQPSWEQFLYALRRFLVIADVDVEVKQPCVGVRLGKLVFPVGRFRAVLTSPELKLVLRHGHINRIYKMSVYTKGYLFKDFIDFFYSLKNKYREENDRSGYLFVKTILNSLYGKFGQKKDVWEVTDEYLVPLDGVHLVASATYGTITTYYVWGGVTWKKVGEEEWRFSHPALASFVTAYGRCYLWRLIRRAGRRHVLYCDTDSLFLTEKGFKRLQKAVSNSKLGALKLEKVHDWIVIKNVKDYVTPSDVKLKGVKKNAVKLCENEYLQEQFYRSKRLNRLGVATGVIIEQVIKRLRREYDKGVVSEKSGRVLPLVLVESAASSSSLLPYLCAQH